MNPADNLIEKVLLWFFVLIGKIIGYMIGKTIYGIRILFRRTINNIRDNKQMTIILLDVKQRLEHTHIVGGSGHGKTQLLQYLFMIDFSEFLVGRGSIIVIDSQGDFIGFVA